jgi:hypothetical protein
MKRTIRRISACCFSLACLVLLSSAAHAQWTAPTPEELSMTSQPEVPGAPAVYLFREEITDDSLHNWSIYARIKVLSERGKDLANVEIGQYSARDDDGFNRGYTVGDIQGRTIHPDGTIIPFTGKPYEKLIEKTQGSKTTAKVFTLPNVEVGSIIEYRYHLRYDDNMFMAPSWFIQSEYFTRKAHYLWKPTGEQLISKDEKGEQLTSAVAWAPILPPGTTVKQTRLPATGYQQDGQLLLEVNVQNIMPMPDEDYMPPIKSLSYRVLFYYSPYRSIDDYWKNQGKGWAKRTDKFVGPGSKVTAAVHDLVAPTDTADQKLRKLYAAVMKLDNSSYNRSRSVAEDKAGGLGPAKTTDDVWERKRGNDDQLADLFVAMARAAGLKAYVMTVTDRNRSIFNVNYLSFSQFDDDIAIVNIDGKDQFFDPGERYCPYGHLAWRHTWVQGLRQTDGASALASTPSESYKDSRIERIADLTLDDHGEATGTLKFTWTGAPALNWRQVDLRGDDTALNHDLQTSVEHMMPAGMDVKVAGIEHLDDYEQPLTVTFNVKGPIGSATGKRLIIPSDIFEANARPTFPHEKREVAVYFNYADAMQDAMRITYPASLTLESQPAAADIPFAQSAHYAMFSKASGTSVTMFRNFARGEIIFMPKEYPDLRAFYNKLETKDQEPIVLKIAAESPGN